MPVFYTDSGSFNNLQVSGSGLVSGSLVVTGSITSTSGFTGSLFGTASYSATASVVTATVNSASFASTASYWSGSITNALSASFASTASSADNFTVRGTLTAQTIIVQTITSSTDFVTGSTRFGSIIENTHQFTGSVSVSGSLAVNGSNVILTNQTSSMSVLSASNAATASYVLASSIIGNLSQIATGSVTASVNVGTSSFALTSGSNTFLFISSSGLVGVNTRTPLYYLDVNGSIRSQNIFYNFNSYFTGYNSGGTANDSLKLVSSNLGASFGVQNLSASGFSGIEYIGNDNNVKVFTGYNNAGAEFRFNNIAPSGYIAFKINSVDKFIIRNDGNIQVSGSLIVTGSVQSFGNNSFLTGSLFGTASWAVNARTSSIATSASFASTASFWSGSIINALSSSFASTASFWSGSVTNALSASFASTSSFVNTLNQNVLIANSLTIGTSSLGSNENTLVVGLPPAGGAGEGGQILLQASGGLYTSASMLDNYQNRFRILRGTNASSDNEFFNVDLHDGQLVFNRYTGSGAFPGTAAANLAIDTSGNVITVAPGTVTSASFASTASFINPLNQGVVITGSLTVVTGSSIELQVINTGVRIGSIITDAHTVTGSLGISGSVTATNFTGSLFGTASWATNALTASLLLGSVTSASFASTASFINTLRQSVILSGSLIITGSTSLTGSLSILGTVSASSYTGSLLGTASFWSGSVINALSSSFAATASLLLGSVVSASFAATASTISTPYYVTQSKGGTWYNGTGLAASDTGSVIVWRAPYPCTASTIYAYREGGTTAAVSASKNGLALTGSNMVLSTATGYFSSSVTQNQNFSTGDRLELALISFTGTVTEINIQVDFRP